VKAAAARQFVLDFFKELANGDEACWERVADDANWKLMARATDYPYPSNYTKPSYRKLVADSAKDPACAMAYWGSGVDILRNGAASDSR
jgi:hypothetical protein